MTGITVITVTRGRPDQLMRAMASVACQDYVGVVEHVVIVDDDARTVVALTGHERSTLRPLRVETRGSVAARREGDRSFVYPHLARLLNVGIVLARYPWVAFLDDDNEFESDHLSSLAALVRETGSLAVHSGRQFVWPDGSPYLERHLPSASTREEGERLYELLCRRGVWVRGTNIVLDRVDDGPMTAAANSTVMGSIDPVFLVDQNLWLISRALLIDVPVPEVFSATDIAENTCPDDKMLAALTAAGVKIRSSGRSTVKYTVGGKGISNGDHVSNPSGSRL